MKHHDSTPDCHNFQRPIPQPHQPSISACLIVKDGAATLDRCLASITPVVNEIIVVDTGSTDTSVEIARRYTDKIFS
jgi:glycosyltransferase involved in cell wall biosynthesis